MGDLSEKIAWIAVIIGLAMQTFVGMLAGTAGITNPFADFDGLEDVDNVVGGILDVLGGFVTQSWAQDFPGFGQAAIAIVFDLAIILLVSSNTGLLITTLIVGLVAALKELNPF